jgi:hypothetical protein
MANKIITQSGGKGTVKTTKLGRKTWCGSGRLGVSCSCGLGCIIGKGKSQKKSKTTRRNFESWSTNTLIQEID